MALIVVVVVFFSCTDYLVYFLFLGSPVIYIEKQNEGLCHAFDD